MEMQLTPVGGLSFFATDLEEAVTAQAGFIVPTLLEPISVSLGVTGDPNGFFTVKRIQVYRLESVLVVVTPPPNGVNPIGGFQGGKIEHQDQWVLVNEVDGPGPVSASAGETVVFDIAFTLGEPGGVEIEDVYQANLNVVTRGLTFAPYPLTASTGHVDTYQQLGTEKHPVYPLYGGNVTIEAILAFGASTYASYRLLTVTPDPTGLISLQQDPFNVELDKLDLKVLNLPLNVSSDVVPQLYTATFGEVAYDGQQSQSFNVYVNVLQPGSVL